MTTPLTAELLPCPFCGQSPELPDGVGTQYEIECQCGMARSSVQICDLMTIEERQTGWVDSACAYEKQFIERAREAVIAAWNRRVPRWTEAEAKDKFVKRFGECPSAEMYARDWHSEQVGWLACARAAGILGDKT